ncbi:MAG TPA: hypothetical protein VK586_05970 [Streptosporangiaceae bacterium]|nr:hypothetical protein [Streptosporangiaceae bacterium]
MTRTQAHAAEVVSSKSAADGWTLHQLADPASAIWEKPRGSNRFRVIERGTGNRGMALLKGTAPSLPAALELAGSLKPSTTAEILARIPAYGDRDRRLIAKLTALGQPGARLFVFGDSAYEAVSEGLALNAAEALFGTGGDLLGCWLIAWRDPEGKPCRGLYANALEDAERAWWILRDGRVVAGGPPIYDESRALELAAEFGGSAVLGTGWAAA